MDRGIGEEEGIGGCNSRAADAWLSLACVAAIAFRGGASAPRVEQRDGSGGAPRDLGRGWRERVRADSAQYDALSSLRLGLWKTMLA